MTDTRQLLRGGQSCRTGPDDGHCLAGLLGRDLRLDPALGPTTVDDGVLNGFDAHRVAIEIHHAGGLARRGANAAGELGEVVGAVQHGQGVVPIVAEHQVVEVRDDVVDGAAVVAKRRAAVHAARRLGFGLLGAQADDKLFVMFQALGHGFVALFDALKFHEASDFSHDVYVLGKRLRLGRGFFGLSRFLGGGSSQLTQGAFVFVGEDLDELAAGLRPIVEQGTGAFGTGPTVVVFEQLLELRLVALTAVPQGLRCLCGLGFFIQHLVQADHGSVAAGAELTVFIKHIGDAAAHARRKVAAGVAQHHHGAASHVFATVVASAFDHRRGT